MITLTTTHTITSQQIADAIITAFEGGSSSWAARTSCGREYQDAATYEQTFSWTITTHEDGDVMFEYGDLERGLQQLQVEYPTYFNDMTAEDGDLDADGADTFFQLCCFGEVVYG